MCTVAGADTDGLITGKKQHPQSCSCTKSSSSFQTITSTCAELGEPSGLECYTQCTGSVLAPRGETALVTLTLVVVVYVTLCSSSSWDMSLPGTAVIGASFKLNARSLRRAHDHWPQSNYNHYKTSEQ